MLEDQQPKVIFLDAVGTLFGIRGSVGEVYGAIARQFGAEVPATLLDRAFFQSFKASNPLAFPGVPEEKIPELEFQWWKDIVKATFAQAGVLNRICDFNAFFNQLYTYFATEQPWYVYSDVLPALTYWQRQGIQLGIISNFDSRIYSVLERLELNHFFTSITISSKIGIAKPTKQIFFAALQKHNCSSKQAWHIGDSLKEDYYGAKTAGLQAFLIERSQ